MAEKTDGIQTQAPKELPPAKHRKQELVRDLSGLTMELLKSAHKSLLARPPSAQRKGELVDTIAESLNFSTVEKFEGWFFALPKITQHILYEAAFIDYLPVPFLEKQWDMSLVFAKNTYWLKEWKFRDELGLDFLPVYNHYGCPVLSIPVFLQNILSLWLAPPSLFQISACRIQDQKETYNNSFLISDVYPLLCDALQGLLERASEGDVDKSLRNGFKKGELNELRSSTGFLPFDETMFFTRDNNAKKNQKQNTEDYMPDSVDLAARFILCMSNRKPERPADGQEGVRGLVEAFFSEKSRFTKGWFSPDRTFLEYNICIDHLSRPQGHYIDSKNELPPSRRIFHDIFLHIAQDGAWFDVDKLAEHIRISRKGRFSFSSVETTLKMKVEKLDIDGLAYSPHPHYREIRPEGILHYYLLARPLLKAYCYFFAALGLLEIVQAMPPLARDNGKKQYPLSPYDSLKAVRITELGRWCLGLTNARPPRPSREYNAIADRELLLVTMQGNSLERQVYLDKVGRRLGEDRWRISPGSFIAGCTNDKQISERIERFKLLIDKNPAPHWEQLFKKVLERAGLFSKARTDMLVYDLPENQEILEELLRDPEFKRIARRIEGRMLAVPSKDQKKFFAVLNEHGIAQF
ncbi:MAG: hypothetical protein FWG66_07605 [Spirochaetes bacterium]|nr:hypothetical protein [Spirochaetota bacterium]